MGENKVNDEYSEYDNQNDGGFHVAGENQGFSLFKNVVLIFFATLVIGIILVSAFLKNAVPNVDLDIGDNNTIAPAVDQEEDSDDNIRMQIDQRLKMIQNEEDMPGVSDGDENAETEESLLIKKLREDTSKIGDKDEKSAKEDVKSQKMQKHAGDTELEIEPVSIPVAEAPKPTYMTKIYIGQFSDKAKAQEMQATINASGVNVNTVVKEVNGYYTIQAGVFSNYEAAKKLADQLNNAGFSAKIVKEIK